MNFLGFGQSAEIEIVFDGAENRKTAEVKGEDGKVEKMLLFYDGETVSGKVSSCSGEDIGTGTNCGGGGSRGRGRL